MEPLHVVILSFIIVGALLMVVNIVFYIRLMLRMRDVISGGVRRDNIMVSFGLVLLVFFLGGYIFVGIYADPHLVTSLILFFGSLFVSVVIVLLTRLLRTSKERSLEITEVLADIIDTRGQHNEGHVLHVKNLMDLFYKYLPRHIQSEYSLVSIEYAALLHDVGRSSIPQEIVDKAGELTPEEEEIVRAHPQVTVRLLRGVKSFDYISDWLLYHHEKVDGTGYYFKKGDSIPLPSKMLAICDAYSKLIKAMDHDAAIDAIQDGVNKDFDEELVHIFVNIPKEDILACLPKRK